MEFGFEQIPELLMRCYYHPTLPCLLLVQVSTLVHFLPALGQVFLLSLKLLWPA
jgi:hypothetical protein